jgi:hypothetical protein
LQTLFHALLNFDDEHVPELVRRIRTCESIEDLAELIDKTNSAFNKKLSPYSPVHAANSLPEVPQFEAELSAKMGDLLLEGSVKFIGGTSNLHYLPDLNKNDAGPDFISGQDLVLSWTSVTEDRELVLHLLNMYFCWHYPYFTTLSKKLFWDNFYRGRPTQHCSALLVNVMLSLGCHFSTIPGAYAHPDDSATAGDHFFREAKRLMHKNDEFAATKVCTVQALALMSVREAGCGREGNGWVYSGMSFRMATDLGLNIDARALNDNSRLSDEDTDARRITFWGCFLFDQYAQHLQGCGKLADIC